MKSEQTASSPVDATESEDVAAQVADMVRAVHNGEPLNRAMGLDDEVIDAAIDQAYTFYANDRFDKAAVLAEGARALDVTRFYPHLLLGDIYLRRGDLTTAVEEFEEALEIRADSAEAKLKLAEAKIRLSCEEEAREALSDVLAMEDLGMSFRDRARVMMEQLD